MRPETSIVPEEAFMVREIVQLFMSKSQDGWWYSVEYPRPGKHIAWDIRLHRMQKKCVVETLAFEFKHDRSEPGSGNLFLETWNCRSNTPSGLTATTADWWAVRSVRRPLCLFRPKIVLEWLRAHAKEFRIPFKTNCGDNNANGYVVRFDLFRNVIPSAELRWVPFL